MSENNSVSVSFVVGDIRQTQGVNQCVKQMISDKEHYFEENIRLSRLYSSDGIYDCNLKSLPTFQGSNESKINAIKQSAKRPWFMSSFFGQSILLIRNYIRLSLRVANRVISNDDSDIYVFHDAFAAAKYLKKRKRKSKVIIVSHSDGDPLGQLFINRDKLSGTFMERALRSRVDSAYMKADCVVVICKSAFEYFEELGIKNIRCITNAAEDISDDILEHRWALLKELKNNKIIDCAVVGSIVPLKGQDRLIEAFSKISEETKKRFRIHFYGTGDKESELKKRVKFLKLDEYFIFHGRVNCIEKYLVDKLALIHPSYKEAVPYAVIEALREGLPVWACDAGDIANMLSGYDAGGVFRSSEEGVIAILNDIAAKHDRLVEMSKEARRCYVNKFDISVQTNRYVKLFQSIV